MLCLFYRGLIYIMTALDFLVSLPHVPMGHNGTMPVTASNSERRRWLMSKSVVINGVRPDWKDEIEFPITELVFFPKSEKKRCTMV